MRAISSSGTDLTPREADDFLREIRSKKGVDDPEGDHYDNVRDLNKSLNMQVLLSGFPRAADS